MFTYLDPTVRERLIAQGKLARINAHGQRLDANATLAPGETLQVAFTATRKSAV